ncbi:hypothetical protein BHE74_00015027 [Ensete ventricosum]|nr:hypothetical protein BHE74_00015027 [Ensete ventricosum]
MKSCHDFDSVVSIECLVAIRECYNIPSEFVLHAPLLRQRSYDPFSNKFSVYVNAIEVGLRFSLHPMIEESCRRASNVRCEGSMGCRDHSLVFLGGLGGSRRSGDKATYQGVSKEPVEDGRPCKKQKILTWKHRPITGKMLTRKHKCHHRKGVGHLLGFNRFYECIDTRTIYLVGLSSPFLSHPDNRFNGVAPSSF